MSPRLDVHELTVTLGRRAILRQVSLQLAGGEILGVFGPSGAGKSTLIAALSGEHRAGGGRVRFEGQDVTAMPLWQRARQGLGLLPQGPSVLWDLTVEQNLEVFARLALRRAGAPERSALLSELELEPHRRTLARSLSGGERRRLELARALCTAPTVLLCDEPFSAADPHARRLIRRALEGAAQAGAAVLIADHHLSDALASCGTACLLHEGEIRVRTAAEAFLEDSLVRRHYTERGFSTEGDDVGGDVQ